MWGHGLNCNENPLIFYSLRFPTPPLPRADTPASLRVNKILPSCLLLVLLFPDLFHFYRGSKLDTDDELVDIAIVKNIDILRGWCIFRVEVKRQLRYLNNVRQNFFSDEEFVIILFLSTTLYYNVNETR